MTIIIVGLLTWGLRLSLFTIEYTNKHFCRYFIVLDIFQNHASHPFFSNTHVTFSKRYSLLILIRCLRYSMLSIR